MRRWQGLNKRIQAGDKSEHVVREWGEVGQAWLTAEQLAERDAVAAAADTELQTILEDHQS